MARKIKLFYKKLFSEFGQQYWWPADSAFEVMIGAILTQNTSWSNVEKAIANLKKNKLLSPKKLRALSRKRLAILIRPAGYFNLKAARISAFLDFIFKRYRGQISKMRAQKTSVLRDELLGVKGIGPETADSMLLYALNKPVFVVDAYTKRILLRHGLISDQYTYGQIQAMFMKNLKPSSKHFNEYHALLVKLGKEFCLKSRKKCMICPLR
ncbi:MAG: endonuclease III domain-containing protein [Candidatus Omnitrophota bacterium]|jgi:endonuclease-3 related protein|nr:MAG: endonuclease III domain-containing protein [Candidatus Omnitrophota bacterium]